MSAVTIIFPHQLFKVHPAVAAGREVYLVEEFLFFSQYRFHQQKLMFHRASMKAYAAFLVSKGIKVHYIEATSHLHDIRKLIPHLRTQNTTVLHFAEPADNWLYKRLISASGKENIQCIQYSTPNFLNTPEGVKPYFDRKKSYFQTGFYTEQRRQRNILLDEAGNPAGGQWTFDSDNRSKFPKNGLVPVVPIPDENDFVQEARNYVAQHFSGGYGSTTQFMYPTDFAGAEKWLDDFLQNRFQHFGIYEDAIVTNALVLHHSVISPLLNAGLLHPQQVIDKAIAAAAQYDVPLNSLEGFIRQVLGWREFIRIIYEREGSKQRTTNYWGFKRKIPESFWTGNTGIAPVDHTIKKVLKTGYCHHIERLMVLGNFMLLCEFDPDEVYRWFMELFIDAYDWVMVPNVYGMTQFADGGLMTTKPYISGSNYLMKMSDYAKGPWQAVWDGLFWRFMHVHRSFFLQNPRLGMLVHTFDKMSAEKQDSHLRHAAQFLNSLDQHG